MPTPKFLKLYPTQKKRAYATGIVLYNRNIFLELQYLAPDQGNGCLHLLTYFSKDCAFKRLCLHLDFLIRLQALPPALITKYLNES